MTPVTELSIPLTTPSVSSSFGIKLPPSSEASEIVASAPNGVSTKAGVLIITGFFIGFLVMFVVAGAVTLLFACKYYRKKEKLKKLTSPSELNISSISNS